MYIGIDVGGTNLKAGAGGRGGPPAGGGADAPWTSGARRPSPAIWRTWRLRPLLRPPAPARRTPWVWASACPARSPGGEVLYTTNIPMEHVPLADAVPRAIWTVPVLLGNDADCAAVGEYFRGAGPGHPETLWC